MSEPDANHGAWCSHPPPPWYRWERFPLVPRFSYRGEDAYNRSDWSLTWLGLTAWTQISPDIGLGFELDDQDFSVRIRVPYLIIRLHVPIFPRALYQKLWRTKPHPRAP
jgi:hypothetical protein